MNLPLVVYSSSLDQGKPQGITADGSISTQIQKDINTYTISGGLEKDINLFHSFQTFNLHSGEKAVFSGSESVKNIISRVTGGSESWINGQIESTISNANLFFINPAGITFGPDAILNITGSFYVSTCQYLKLSDNSQLSTDNQNEPIVTSADPIAFGFNAPNQFFDSSSSTHAPVKFEGGVSSIRSNNNDKTGLNVPQNQDIVIIGGNIIFKQGLRFENDTSNTSTKKGNLYAKDGSIRLISLASQGEYNFIDEPMDFSGFDAFGEISLLDGTIIDVSGNGGGCIAIKAGKFYSQSSKINLNNYGDKKGCLISIQADTIIMDNSEILTSSYGAGDSSDVLIHAINDIEFNYGSRIMGYINSSGNGGTVTLIADHIKFQNNSSSIQLGTFYYSSGNSGNIHMDARNITFTDSSYLTISNRDSGAGGHITLNASEDVIFRDPTIANMDGVIPSRIFLRTYGDADDAGAGGTLTITAKNIRLEDGCFFTASASGRGQGGSITLKASDSVILSGKNKSIDSIFFETHISADVTKRASYFNQGNGGFISIQAKHIIINDGATIDSSSYGSGDAGDIILNATDSIDISGNSDSQSGGIYAKADSPYDDAGNGGSIHLSANKITLSNNGVISTSTSSNGNAGHIFIEGNDLKEAHMIIKNGAIIDSTSYGRGYAGNIDIKSIDRIDILGAPDSQSGGIYANADSPYDDAGNGGSIHLNANMISLSKNGFISTSTSGHGNAGDIIIEGNYLSVDQESRIISSNIGFKSSVIDKPSYTAKGTAGSIFIDINQFLNLNHSLITTSTVSIGNAGLIQIKAGNCFLTNHASIASSSQSTVSGSGEAGYIHIALENEIQLKNQSKILTEAINSGGGKISIKSNNLVYLFQSQISTSVADFSGDGGDITIQTGFVALNKSGVNANAHMGDGGNISIESNYFMEYPLNSVTAISTFGNEGTISIYSPDEQGALDISFIKKEFLQSDIWLTTMCDKKGLLKVSRLIVNPFFAAPTAIEDSKPSHLTCHN